MGEGVATAYGAVMKPAEGTVLTVSRLAAARAAQAAQENPSAEYVLEQAILAGQETLAQTIDMNPVLKKAGVVDAGGKGYLIILDGMLRALRGEELPQVEEDEKAQDKADFGALSLEDITFTYDTVFIVRKKEGVSIEPFRAYLDGIGDSLVPGQALTEAAKYGTLELAKIENMRTQAEELAAGKQAQSTDDLDAVEEELEAMEGGVAAPEKRYGFLAVCAGDGLAATFRDLGVDRIVSGGQTMNPSTEDMLNAIDQVNADTVFILPNNKNIILAANQAKSLVEDKEIIVIPTKTVPQGITAIINFMPDADVKTNEEAMLEEIKNVKTGQMTYAVRDTHIDDKEIHEGDIMGIGDSGILAVGKDLEETTKELIANLVDEDSELISIYYGEEVSEEEAEKFAGEIEELYPDVDVDIQFGGQPIYYYVLAVE